MQRICPQCRTSNPMDNQFCGHCGATLQALVPHKNRELTPYDDSAKQLKQIGQTVAVSLLALAAEAGLAYLRRRLESNEGRPEESKALQPVERSTAPSATQPTAVSLRVTEVHHNGRLVQRTVERAAWWWRDA